LQDNGIGMNETQQANIFKPFTQADNSTTRQFGGTGLGLAISKNFAKMMGGKLQVSSVLGEGSCFTLLLPVVCDPDRLADLQDEDMIKQSQHVTTFPKQLILLIANQSQPQQQLQQELEQQYYAVVMANDLASGAQLARKLCPSVIMLDHGYTVVNVSSFISKLENTPILEDCLLLALGENNFPETQGLMKGFNDFFPNPVDINKVLLYLTTNLHDQRNWPLAMVVEDQAIASKLMITLLKKNKWRGIRCENGQIALDHFQQHKPDLVILDLNMPDMDGFEFLIHLREHETWFKTPAIIVSGAELSEEETLRLTGQGITIFKKGEFNNQTLIDKVQSYRPNS